MSQKYEKLRSKGEKKGKRNTTKIYDKNDCTLKQPIKADKQI